MVLSIIIPFYNAASSLWDTVDSIRKQSFSDIEIILIDDGSTDNGYAVAKNIAEEDGRIKIFQQENKGVSSARNLGLKMAEGRYVTFVDADDLVDQTMYEELMKNVLNTNVDTCISGMQQNGIPMNDLPENTQLLEGKNEIQKVVVGNLLGSPGNSFTISPSACRMIIDRKLLEKNSIQFDTRISYHEDFVFCIDLFLRVNRAYIDSRPFYKYIYNKSEHNQRHKISKIIESEKYVIRFLKEVKERTSEDIQININIAMIRSITLVSEYICRMHSESISKQLRLLKQFYSECKPNIDEYFWYKNISLKQKILFWLLSHRFFIPFVIVCWAIRLKSSFNLHNS